MIGAAAAVLAAMIAPASAQIAWDRGAGTDLWTDALNWSGDALPTSANSVEFADAGAGTVNLNGTTQPASGSLQGVTFINATTGYTIQNGTLNTTSITNASGAGVTNTISATLNVGGVTVSSGSLVLGSGANVITGPVSVAAGSVLDVAGPASESIGAVTLAGGTIIVRGSVTTINNAMFDRVYLRAPAQSDLNPISNLFGFTPNATRTITGPVTYSLSRAGGAGDNNGLYSTRTLADTYQGGNHNNIETLTTAKLTISIDGTYTFGTRSDDGSVLYIDLNNDSIFDPATEMVVNNNNFQGYTNRVGTRTLASGTYNMAIGYYQGGCCNDNGLEVRYGSGTIAEAAFDSMTVLNPSTPLAGTSFSFDSITQASIANSNINITGANSVLSIQSPTGVAGNLSFLDATSLTIDGSGGAAVNVGSVNGAGTATLTTNVATTAGALSGLATFNKAGANSLTLASDSTGFDGQINVTAGTLRAANTNALGSALGNTVVNSGAQLNLVADNIAEPVTIAGTGPGNTGALASSGAARTFAGPVTLSNNASIISATAGNFTLTLTGGVNTAGFETRFGGAGNVTVATAGITGAGSIRKADGGTLQINAASDYTGPTHMENGTLDFSQPLSGTSAINVTGGTVNARSAVNAAATVTVTGGTYNAILPGALNATNIVSGTGLVRVTGDIGATGSISVTNKGRLHFDAGTGNTASVLTDINVTDGGIVRSSSGIADLSLQDIVITPQVTFTAQNALRAAAITIGSDTNPDSLANISAILAKTASFNTTLPNGVRGDLNFPQATGDASFSAFFGTTLPDAFTAYFTGRYTAPVDGVYNFRRTDNDDTAAVAVDLNNNGSFLDVGTDVFASGGCCNNDQSVDVTLTAGQSIGVFWGTRDTGGGSGLVGRFTEPAGGTFTSVTIVDPGTQTGRWSYEGVTGGGDVQVDAGSELRINTVTGATNLRLGGELNLSAGAGKASNTMDIRAISALGEANVGAGHTLTAETISATAGAVLTKTGAGTLTVTDEGTLTLNDAAVVASEGLLDLSNTRLGALPRVTQQGLQGLLYTDSTVDPRNNPNGVSALLNGTPASTRVLTSATGPNGGLDFRDDNQVASFFNNPTVASATGNANYTKAFVGSFTAQASGNYTFGLEQNDDNTAIFIDSNQNGVFEISDQVFQRGCCLQNPPNADFESGFVNLTAGQIYDIAIVNQDTGGGGNLGVKFMEPLGGTVTTLSIVAPGAAGQTTQFNYTTGGGDLRVDVGATLSLRGTDAPLAATVAGTLHYSAQASATSSSLSSLTVPIGETGTIETGANQVLNLGAGTSVVLDGNLVKTGAGRLAVNVATTGNGAITVNGGILGGTGTIAGTLTAGVSGTVAPGNSVGTLASGDFALAGAGATLGIELDPQNLGGLGLTDNLNVTGLVALNGGNLSLSLISTSFTIGQEFVIISNDLADSVIGTFGTANGSPIVNDTFSLPGGFAFEIDYTADTGNDVSLTVMAVPEPGTISVLMLGLGAILSRRRRAGTEARA